MPASEIRDNMMARLAALFGTVPAFTHNFTRTAWFGDEVLWLASDADQVFRSLTELVWTAVPAYPPLKTVRRSRGAIASAWLDRCLKAGPFQSEVLPPGDAPLTIVGQSRPASLRRARSKTYESGTGRQCQVSRAHTAGELHLVWRAVTALGLAGRNSCVVGERFRRGGRWWSA